MRYPKLHFFGTSHAAVHLRWAAEQRNFVTVSPEDADLLFVSEDTPTDSEGRRNLEPILILIGQARRAAGLSRPVVVTSAVHPEFFRLLGYSELWHQAETLRIKDAKERAIHPEMLIVGSSKYSDQIPNAYATYLAAWNVPVHHVTWEEAAFAKMAINVTLAAQVDCTNRLAHAADKAGANWEVVADILRCDKRIGPHAYLEQGRWQDSRHLLRDMRTLEAIENA